MFIISKRNFMARRADGSSYYIKKDYVGEIPQDVFESGIVQGAIKGGLIAASEKSSDKDMQKAEEKAEEAEAAADIRPDAQKRKEELNTPEETEKKKATAKKK